MEKNKKKIKFLSIILVVVSLLTAYFVYSYFNKDLDSDNQIIEEIEEINLGAAPSAVEHDGGEAIKCNAGQYLSGNRCIWCPSPYDSSAAGSTSSSKCYAVVSAGKYIPTANGKIENCPAGTYRSGNAIVFKGKTNSCTKCADGYTSAEGASSCYYNCRAHNNPGTCSSGAASSYCGWCNGGCYAKSDCPTSTPTVAPSPTATSSSNQGDCAANMVLYQNYYCTVPSGKKCNINGGSTYYSAGEKITYSQSGSVTISSCINDSPTEAECKDYCADTGAAYASCLEKCLGGSAISSCEANEYLSNGACVSCPKDYPYSGAGSTKISDCGASVPAGKYIKTKNGTAESCPKNTYSSTHIVYYGSTSSCTSCPTSFPNASSGSDSINDCYASILSGYYVNSNGEKKLCAVGTYGSSSITTVYYGKTSSCTSCPAGYTTSGTGKTKSSDCYVTVSAGQYIKTAGGKPENCPANTYSTTSGNIYNGNTTSCAKCPDGYTSTAGSSVCKISVSKGQYVATAGTKPVNCPVGSYNATAKTVNSDSTSTCVVCPTGYTTSSTGSTSGNDCKITIQAGYYISSPGGQAVACPKGTYTTAAQTVVSGNTTACITCPANYTTAGTGSTGSSACNVLAATSVGACSDGMQVPKNYYCSVPSTLKCGKTGATLGTSIIIGPASVKCESVPSNSNTITCGAGTYYTGQGNISTCSSGYYCPEHTYDLRDDNQGGYAKCPTEYPYSATGSASINDCYRYVWPGDYIKTAGTAATACPKGTYNDEPLHTINYGGTSSCKSCPKGYTTSGTGAKSEDECNQSDGAVFTSAGYCVDGMTLAKNKYCDVPSDMKCGAVGAALLTSRIQAINPTDIVCERATCGQGKYMVGNDCRSCPSGYNYSSYGAKGPDECYMFIHAGEYVKTSKGQAVACPKGTYNSSNYVTVYYGSTSECTNCPDGFTTTSTGSTNENSCSVAVSSTSTYCNLCGNNTTCLTRCVCPPGSYISGNTCQTCPAGTYSKGGVVYDCTNCPVGTNSVAGASSCVKQQSESTGSCDCPNDKSFAAILCAVSCAVTTGTTSGTGDALKSYVLEHPCDFITLTPPGELSPDSGFRILISYSPILEELMRSGDVSGKCTYNYSISNNGKSKSDDIIIDLSDATLGDFDPRFGASFKECTDVTYVINGSSGTIKVKSKWSTTKSSQSFEKDAIIPSYSEDADSEGVSYYDATNCKSSGNSKTCDVYTRHWCGEEPKYACYYNSSEKKYCWSTSATSCGSGYKLESSIKSQSSCANACYCNSSSCEIRAKKTWSGYTELKDANGNSITNANLCKKQEQCYISSTTNQYCWGVSASACGKNFTLDSTVKSKDNCTNVCYCEKNTDNCKVQAKKTWENYEPLKTYSGTYITDVNQCKRYSYCCVDNGYVDLSNDVYYEKNKQSKVCKDGYTLLENVSEANCKKPPAVAGSCKSSPIIPPEQNKSATECESNVLLEINDGQRCTNNTEENNSFYSITCVKKYNSSFDYGNDGSSTTERKLYIGGGISFKINVDAIYNCNYTFYNTVWDNTYNSVLKRIGNIDSNLVSYVTKKDKAGYAKYINNTILKRGVKDASSLYEWWNIIEELKLIINDYKEYEPDISGDLKTEATITTKESGTEIKKKYSFQQIINDTGKTIRSDVTRATLKDGTVVESYIVNNDPEISAGARARSITLIPKKTCVNRFTNAVVDANDDGTCPVNTVDGGNKMYIGYNTDKTSGTVTYPMSIKITGFNQGNSTIENNKCSIKVSEAGLIYRPIDVYNPFINSEWKIGVNWANSLYDFTKVIHDTTWSEAADKKISLSANDIVEIKESNSKYRSNSPYLGLCDKITEPDLITGKICEAIK